jgi:predicted DNA binding protein
LLLSRVSVFLGLKFGQAFFQCSSVALMILGHRSRFILLRQPRADMKRIRITVRPDLDQSPQFLAYLLDSPDVAEARAVDWNRGATATSTHLYAIDGDGETFVDLAADTPGVESVTHTATDGSVSYAILELRDEDVPIFGGSAEAIDRAGLVVRRPLVYRDGQITGHIVGDPDILQATIDRTPAAVSVQIDEIRQFPGPRAEPTSALSERQREALETALELGYYDTPRDATHEDIADELGCAPNTASQHLQKGEAKLVRTGLDADDLSQ